MSADKKPNELDAWKQFLEEEIQKMQLELEKISDPQKRSEFKDQLIWLFQQMKNFEETQDVETMQESLQWVANSFNNNLKPQKPFKHKP